MEGTGPNQGRRVCFVQFARQIHTINLPESVPLGGVYDGGGASPVGLRGHVIRCGSLAAAAAVYGIRAEGRGRSIPCVP